MFSKQVLYNGIHIDAGLGGVTAQRGRAKKVYTLEELIQRVGPIIEQDIAAIEKEGETQV